MQAAGETPAVEALVLDSGDRPSPQPAEDSDGGDYGGGDEATLFFYEVVTQVGQQPMVKIVCDDRSPRETIQAWASAVGQKRKVMIFPAGGEEITLELSNGQALNVNKVAFLAEDIRSIEEAEYESYLAYRFSRQAVMQPTLASEVADEQEFESEPLDPPGPRLPPGLTPG